jgi:hypothetical protein
MERDMLAEIERLRLKIDRIYEVCGVEPEPDDSVINMVEFYRRAWTVWQGHPPQSDEALKEG